MEISAWLGKVETKSVSLSNHKANIGGGSEHNLLMPKQCHYMFSNYLC